MLTLLISGGGKVIFEGENADFQASQYIWKRPHLSFDLEEMEETTNILDFPLTSEVLYPSCEHGLSLSLCAGPNHYPMDNEF